MKWLPFGDLTRRAIDETRADLAHETRGRGAGKRLLRIAGAFAAIARILAKAIPSFDEPLFSNLGRDVRSAARRLAAAPGFTLFSVASLALGIGATTAVYTLIYSLFLRPIDVPHLDRLVNVETADARRTTPLLSMADFDRLRANQTACASFEASSMFHQTLVGLGTGELISAEVVNGDYFRTLGVGAAIGRTIGADDDRADAAPVIVLGDRTWRRQFGADPDVIGKTVKIASVAFEIIGIAPAYFRGALAPNIIPTAAWVPIHTSPLKQLGLSQGTDAAGRPFLRVRGWLAPGRSVGDAAAQFATIGARLDIDDPLPATDVWMQAHSHVRQWSAIPSFKVFTDEVADARAVSMASVALGLTGLVLLVACTNLAGLALARGTARQHELAVRRALGASRWRLVREQMIESAAIAGAAVLPAVVIAIAAMHWIVAHLPLSADMALQFEPRIDLPTIAFALGGGFVALLVAGVWPAWQLTRADVRAALVADTSSNAALPRWKGRSRLIAWQVLCSVCLVFLAVLAAEGVLGVRPADAGMAIDQLSMAQPALPPRLKDDARSKETFTELLRLVRLQPRVTSASLVGGLSFGSPAIGGVVTTPDKPFRAGADIGQSIALASISTGAFQTLGAPITKGRAFSSADGRDAPRVVIVANSLARELFGSTNPIGRTVMFYGGYGFTPKSDVTTATIIGVAADVSLSAVWKEREKVLYLPFAQADPSQDLGMMIAANSAAPAATAADMRATIKRFDPEITLVRSGAVRTAWEGPFVALRTLGVAVGVLGGLALVLAMAGLYGVLSQMVLRRRREIGVRMALGADRRDIARLVLREGFRPVLGGIVAGLVIGVAVRIGIFMLMKLAGRAIDPTSLLIVPVPFIVAAFVACYLPARRAARVDPNVALRDL